jgi:hypothetical protein
VPHPSANPPVTLVRGSIEIKMLGRIADVPTNSQLDRVSHERLHLSGPPGTSLESQSARWLQFWKKAYTPCPGTRPPGVGGDPAAAAARAAGSRWPGRAGRRYPTGESSAPASSA